MRRIRAAERWRLGDDAFVIARLSAIIRSSMPVAPLRFAQAASAARLFVMRGLVSARRFARATQRAAMRDGIYDAWPLLRRLYGEEKAFYEREVAVFM